MCDAHAFENSQTCASNLSSVEVMWFLFLSISLFLCNLFTRSTCSLSWMMRTRILIYYCVWHTCNGHASIDQIKYNLIRFEWKVCGWWRCNGMRLSRVTSPHTTQNKIVANKNENEINAHRNSGEWDLLILIINYRRDAFATILFGRRTK